MAPEDKSTCPEDVDRLISAEIPEESIDPLAYDTVARFMIHGPCVSFWLTEHVQNITQKDFVIKPHLMSMDSLNTIGSALPNKWL